MDSNILIETRADKSGVVVDPGVTANAEQTTARRLRRFVSDDIT